jgi:tRNA(adenine34) deaminase
MRSVDRDEAFMQAALDEALVAPEHGDVPVGAVLVRGGDVIARAHNTEVLTGDPSAHAELNVVRLGAERMRSRWLDDCELFATLEPCPMCAGAILLARVRRLVFGAWNPRWGACGTLANIVDDPRRNHRVEVVRGVLAEACGAPLESFFAGLRG